MPNEKKNFSLWLSLLHSHTTCHQFRFIIFALEGNKPFFLCVWKKAQVKILKKYWQASECLRASDESDQSWLPGSVYVVTLLLGSFSTPEQDIATSWRSLQTLLCSHFASTGSIMSSSRPDNSVRVLNEDLRHRLDTHHTSKRKIKTCYYYGRCGARRSTSVSFNINQISDVTNICRCAAQGGYPKLFWYEILL